jgi:5'-phosphate synthase pdxT subunit
MGKERPYIGVLAMQGAFHKHVEAVHRCGVEAREVRTAEEIAASAGLIIPGGESTTIGMLIERFALAEAIRGLAARGAPIFGTCAGMILMARDIVGSVQPRLGFMDISVRRNAFGRQVDSFETDLAVQGFGRPVRAVFIRAPYIEAVAPHVNVLAEFKGNPVLARQDNFLVAAFHPELTDDPRIHQYFLGMVPL